MRRSPLLVKRLISQSRDPRNSLTFKQAERRWRKLPGWSRDDVEPQRATRFTSALRLCISGCVCSTKRSLLSVFVAPERDLRPHERSFGAKRARAPFRAQLRPAPSSFSTQDRLLLIQFFFHFLLLYPIELDWRSDSKEATCSDEGEIIWGSYVNLFRLIQKLRKNLPCCTLFI